MKDPNRFYTYAYLREDRSPYYIGKGQTHRLLYKPKTGDVRPPKDKSRIIFLKQNLTEEEAFKHEIYMIAVFGRKDLGTGILRNRTNGGEGSSGWVPNEKDREKMSKGGISCKERGVGMFGRSEEKIKEDNSKGGKIGGNTCKEKKVGVCGLSKEQLIEAGKKGRREGKQKGGKKGGKVACKITNSQKWMCLETGYITTSGPLTKYQRAKSIDTSKRIRIE